MKTTITATVVYAMNVEIECEEDLSEDEKKNLLYEAAKEEELGDLIIHECSDEDLID